MIKHVISATLILLLLLLFTFKNNSETPLLQYLDSIEPTQENNQFNSIFKHLKARILHDPTHEDYVLFGDFLFRFGYAEASALLYQRGIDLAPDHYQALIGLAVSLDELGYSSDAITAYGKASQHAEEKYQVTENTHRIGELYLKLEQIDKALSVFNSLHYAPSIVKRCRIHIRLDHFEKALAEFDLLLKLDTKNESLEVYQLNALAFRHFDRPFTDLSPNRNRELCYSEHIPMRMRKALAEHTFGLYINDVFGDEIRQLPIYLPAINQFSDEQILEATLIPDRINSGKQIYTNSGCVICHGVDGSGVIGPNLLDDYWLINDLSPSSIYSAIQHGRNDNTMPAFKNILDTQQIKDVSAYVIHLYRRANRNQNGETQVGKKPQGIKQFILKNN